MCIVLYYNIFGGFMLKFDLSGLEDFAQRLEQIDNESLYFNARFLEIEFEIFKEAVIKKSPVDTGNLIESYESSEVRSVDENTVEADWKNTARSPGGYYYAHKVNYETARQVPTYFWERGLNAAKIKREDRYSALLEAKFESLGG